MEESRSPGGLAQIKGVGHALPSRRVSSAEVEDRVALTTGFRMPLGVVQAASGVVERRYAARGTASSDLASAAAEKALSSAGLKLDDIDCLIFASASHDITEPATSNIVQAKLGCTRAHVMDVKNACNSFVNALDIATMFIEVGRAQNVLIASGEVISPTIDYRIEGTDDLELKMAGLTLGDAGAAAVVSGVEPGTSPLTVRSRLFESYGSAWGLSTVLAGGNLYGIDPSKAFFSCNSKKITDMGVETVPPAIKRFLAEMKWKPDSVETIVPHQVSKRVVKRVASECSLPLERWVLTLQQYGNTAAASIPLALSSAWDTIQTQDRVMLAGAAAGFSIGLIGLERG